jgi:hypothetical protein
MTKILVLWLIVLGAFASELAYGFPEMVRHGYMSCTACHTSVVGGNMLNPYGRSLSQELLSQKSLFGKKSSEGDAQILGGAIEPLKWWQIGGDIRLLQTLTESKESSKARFLIMQVELEAMAQIKNGVNVFSSLGRIEPKQQDATARDFLYVPRWGIDSKLTSPEEQIQMGFRVGRFMPAFGINFAEHVFATRSFLEFGPGQERFAGEFSWANDRTSLVATVIAGQASGNQNKFEQGGILQVSTALGEKSKVGVNYYRTKRNDNSVQYDRMIYGGFAYLSFAKDWYALFEADVPKGVEDKSGFVETTKLGKEVFQGLQVFATHEFANLDSDQAHPRYEAYGLGAEWFPQAHWDLYSAYRMERNTALSNEFQNVLWLLGHYYL